MRASLWRGVEAVLVTGALALGWAYSLTQAVSGHDPSGTVWLLVFAVIATVGAVSIVYPGSRDRPWGRAVGLLLVVASPTVFFYPLNAAVLLCAVVEAVRAVRTAKAHQRAVRSLRS